MVSVPVCSGRSRLLPGIDQFDPAALEIAGVARGEFRVVGERDGGNHEIQGVGIEPSLLTVRRQYAERASGRVVKGKNRSGEPERHKRVETSSQTVSSFA